MRPEIPVSHAGEASSHTSVPTINLPPSNQEEIIEMNICVNVVYIFRILSHGSSGFFCGDVGREDHLLDAFREIPAFDDLIAPLFFLNGDVCEPCIVKHTREFLHGNRTGDSAAVGMHILLKGLREIAFLEDVR